MSKKCVCIHGHFYQPPRENAKSGVIDLQPSAYPFHDWNERIHSECYAANAQAKIHIYHAHEPEYITEMNNYDLISFNFGPTLLHWMQKHASETYEKIIAADKRSCLARNGHGNAIAQVYNHSILPLANKADKKTQIYWGIQDFVFHFGRQPEGMWLAETAVDTETLTELAAQGIKFTVLSPRQAKAWKKTGSNEWNLIKNQYDFDTNRPYIAELPGGESITIFFYNGSLATDVAFNNLLSDGNNFMRRILHAKSTHNEPELIHLATDGETYGHHHRYGEMGLAACLYFLQKEAKMRITNYAAYLAENKPDHVIQIHENSSWSCVHGVERWRSNCGCSDGGNSNFHQNWRKPLREAFDWLREKVELIYCKCLSKYAVEPEALRNHFIEVILDNSKAGIFINRHFGAISQTEKELILTALEMQKFAQFMYTSCAWFFDEVSRIETKQILQYAKQAVKIAEIISGKAIEPAFLELLKKVPSNVSHYTHAGAIYAEV